VSAGWGRVGSRQVLTRQVRIPRAKCETLARRVNHAMLVLGKSDVIRGLPTSATVGGSSSSPRLRVGHQIAQGVPCDRAEYRAGVRLWHE